MHTGDISSKNDSVHKTACRIGEAIAGYYKSYLLSPDSPTIFCNYMYTKFFACDWSDYKYVLLQLLLHHAYFVVVSDYVYAASQAGF